jgi:DinB superfamily
MNRRELETLFLTLESTPVLFERAALGLSPQTAQQRPAGGGFSLVENVWHLADLEREGFGVRIRRILSEEEPTLSNFDGDRVARERDYQSRDLASGLAAFRQARRRSVEILRTVASRDWKRPAVQDGFGFLTLEDLPRLMAEHDRSHTADVSALLEEIARGCASAPFCRTGSHRVSAFA